MSARKPRVALVSRELAPFGGGGIGPYVRALGDALEGECEVTLFTTSRHRKQLDRLTAASDGSLPRSRVALVDEPRSWDARRSYNVLHAWSARAHEALRAEYGDNGPELIEFPDFLGEGCVTVQAKRTRAAWLRSTTVAVRAYGTAEIYDVLDGFLPRERERAFTHELERYALRYADAFLWPGGDVLATYERFYGADELAPATQISHPFSWEGQTAEPVEATADGPLRLLYLGRLERRKGIRELVAALTGLPGGSWTLTVAGGDTPTAPLGQSMRALLEDELAGDPRVEMLDSVPRQRIPALIDAHDVVVVPSRWECWPNVALEAMDRGRPVLATPTGGMAEIVEPGSTGWLAGGTGARELVELLAPLVADPAATRAAIAPTGVRERFSMLTDVDPVRARYAELAAQPTSEAVARVDETESRVSIVIPYFESERWVGEAVSSALAQANGGAEVLVVNDGSFRAADRILLELDQLAGVTVLSQPNSGVGAARNFGIGLARGKYVLPLDADNVLEPSFVDRALEVLEADPAVAYVTSWLRYIDDRGRPWKGTEEGLQPIGNSSRYVEVHNVAGDGTALFRREVFDSLAYSADVAGFEDWTLYREMRRRGLIGHVIPEPLIAYRVRRDSMMRRLSSPREEWLEQAIDADLREREIEWTAAGR